MCNDTDKDATKNILTKFSINKWLSSVSIYRERDMLRFELYKIIVKMFLYFGGRLKLMLSMKNFDIFILWDRKGQ